MTGPLTPEEKRIRTWANNLLAKATDNTQRQAVLNDREIFGMDERK